MTTPAVDLSKIPFPGVVETLDYNDILSQIKQRTIALAPELAAVLSLESDPLVKQAEVVAERAVNLRARINDAAKAVMLAYSSGTDLDNKGADYNVVRLAEETDERFRQRIQLSLEGFSTAGPVNAYKYWALTSSNLVKDVSIDNPAPVQVVVVILSTIADGTANQELLDTVQSVVNADDIRPLTDLVSCQSAEIITYQIEADIAVGNVPDAELVRSTAEQGAQQYSEQQHRLGKQITISGLYAALHVEGVSNVNLIQPAAAISTTNLQAPYCTSVSVTLEQQA